MSPIHAAKIYPDQYILLNKDPEIPSFQWYFFRSHFDQTEATGVKGVSIAEAIQQGYQYWETSYFRLLHCGFCYTLPERDEVGSNALFWQMALSYNAFNGRYFDDEVGHLCYVDFASEEALQLWKTLRSHKPLASIQSSKQ